MIQITDAPTSPSAPTQNIPIKRKTDPSAASPHAASLKARHLRFAKRASSAALGSRPEGQGSFPCESAVWFIVRLIAHEVLDPDVGFERTDGWPVRLGEPRWQTRSSPHAI